jgi:hypothetical protein
MSHPGDAGGEPRAAAFLPSGPPSSPPLSSAFAVAAAGPAAEGSRGIFLLS